MLEEGNEEILKVATYLDLTESCRLLWIKLWLLYGEEEILTTRANVAKSLKEKQNAFFVRWKFLKRAGAIRSSAHFANKRGSLGVKFQVIHPDKWIK